MDQEHGLLNQQVQSLSEDLARHTTEMTNTRREYTNNLVTLRTQLAEKTEEVFVYFFTDKLYSKILIIHFAAYSKLPNISQLHNKYKETQRHCSFIPTRNRPTPQCLTVAATLHTDSHNSRISLFFSVKLIH